MMVLHMQTHTKAFIVADGIGHSLPQSHLQFLPSMLPHRPMISLHAYASIHKYLGSIMLVVSSVLKVALEETRDAMSVVRKGVVGGVYVT